MNASLRDVSSQDTAESLKQMTFPAYREHIEPARNSSDAVVAIVAEIEGQTVGLVLGSVYPDAASGALESTLMSVFVKAECRNHGIGTALVSAFQQATAKRGVTNVSVLFMEGKPGTAALTRILAKTGWAKPEGRMIAIKQKATDALHPDYGWCRPLPYPDGLRVIPWTEVTAQQQEAIRVWQESTLEIPPYLCPDEVISHAPLQLGTSVALEIEGEILGWVLTQPLDGGVLRFTASYVKRDLQRRALLLYLLYESVSRMEHEGFPEGIWTVPAQDARMYRFALRRIAPHSEYCRETKIAVWSPVTP